MASLHELNRLGQSIWLDFIDRNLLDNGGLQRLVDGGVSGVTTNPTIFHKAITGSADYDASIRTLIERDPNTSAERVCEALMVADVQAAADVLRGVYERTGGADGYVSLEVPPDLAFEATRTVAMAHHLWNAVSRPNVMIKVPGTSEGVEAFESLTADGINVNVTLLFSVEAWQAVAQAHLRALERRVAAGQDVAKVASVASFFVSRIDTLVDQLLAHRLRPDGSTPFANAKLAYQRFRALSAEPVVAAALAAGARPQRPLWASTSTKNPAYRDVLYVETLIGRDTVNTVPPETLNAFLDHGQAQATLDQNLDQAQRDVAALGDLGIDLDAITRQLESEGVAAFAESWQKLLGGVREKCAQVAGVAQRRDSRSDAPV
ncbi:MAG: transaldolase [Burkholderiales bacterium]|nr:transaldolase [Burkholderiales bacterium]